MKEFDLEKAKLKDSKEGKSKDKLLKKRKREAEDAGLDIGEGKQPEEAEANKRQRIE